MGEASVIVVSKLISIGIIVISMMIGLLSFLIFSDESIADRKKLLHELTSQIINFIIFLWIGKVLWNLSIFISDPMAVIAYPSNSEAFYLAVLFIVLLLFYKSYRKQMELIPFLDSSLHVFFVSSFVYEFIQLVWENHTYNFGYLILLAVLLVGYFFLRDRLNKIVLIMTMLVGWSFGVFLLFIIQPFVTVFGYMLEPWFVAALLIVSFLIIIFKCRKGDD